MTAVWRFSFGWRGARSTMMRARAFDNDPPRGVARIMRHGEHSFSEVAADALPAAEELALVIFNYDDTALVFSRFNLLPDLIADALAHEASSPLHPNNRPAGYYGQNAPKGIA